MKHKDVLPQEVDVAIVGCGPVGAVAANFLGMYGLRCAVLEREEAAHGQPRAFSCDDEALRIYQQIGLAERLQADMKAPERVNYLGLHGRSFADIEVGRVDFGSGYSPLHFFHQPTLEAILRAGLERFPGVSLHLGCELTGLQVFGEGALLEVSSGGEQSKIAARFVLGCDGARSAVRRLAGVAMAGKCDEKPWLAIAGFAPASALRVSSTSFVCDPRRPGFVGIGPAGEVRIDLMVLPGEDPTEIAAPSRLRELIAPFVDPARYDLRRAAVYRYGNHVAERWQVGPVLLLGDAAHLMPPFMGQGLVSGLRDVVNVAWKLALVIRGAADPALLATYERERRQHTQSMIDASVRMGYVFLSRSRWSAALRDTFLRAIQRIGRVHRWIHDFEFKPRPSHPRGFYLGGGRSKGAVQGTYFPQAEVLAAGERRRSDDVLGPGFAVVSREVDPRAVFVDDLQDRIGARAIRLRAGASGEASDVVDPSGRLLQWFQRNEVDLAIVRPDRFVFAAGRVAEGPALGRALAGALHGQV